MPDRETDSREFDPALPGDRFEVLEHLGRGGMGTVFRVKDKILQRTVAVKLLGRDFAQSLEQVRRMQGEAKALARLDHRNILKVLDFGNSEKSGPYIITELIDGQSVEQIINAHGPIETGDAIEMGIQIADGLAHAHKQGILHRDLKPSNVLITTPDDAIVVKVIDLGLAKVKGSDQRLTRTGAIIGSPHYMSPEQIHDQTLDERADIYSFGCLLYTMLTGMPPFDGETMDVYNKHLLEPPPSLSGKSWQSFSPLLESIVAKCLCKKPEDRFQSMAELKGQLVNAAHEHAETVHANKNDDLEETPIKEKDNQHSGSQSSLVWKVAAGCLLVLLVVASAFSIAFRFKEPAPNKISEGTDSFLGDIPSDPEKGDFLGPFRFSGDEHGGFNAYPQLGVDVDQKEDEVLKDLPKLPEYKKLHSVFFTQMRVTGTGLKYLQQAPVHILWLDETKLNDDGAKNILLLPRLQQVDVTECPSLTNAGLKEIVKHPGLEMISVGPYNLNRTSLSLIAGMPRLTRLCLRMDDKKLPDGFPDEFRKTKLWNMEFVSCHELTVDNLLSINKLPSVQSLILNTCEITSDYCKAIAKLKLNDVTFQSCTFKPEALKPLASKKNLKLRVYLGNVPLDDLLWLRKNMSDLTLFVSDLNNRDVNIDTVDRTKIPSGTIQKGKRELKFDKYDPKYGLDSDLDLD